MYDDRFGTDWEHLTADECLDRAFALGVYSVVEQARTEEYERLLDLAENAYGRGLIEMSYREGRARAQELRSDGLDATGVWDVAVDEADRADDHEESDEPDEPDDRPPRRGREGPPNALDRHALFERPSDDSTERLSIPEFLRRRS